MVEDAIEISVIQEGRTCDYTFSDNVVQIPANGGSVVVQLTAELDECSWKVHNSAEWLYPSPAQGLGTEEIILSVYAENKDAEAREATITVADQTLTVVQAGQESPARLVPEEILGWWWDPQQSGSGISIESHTTGNDTIFLGWFTYSDDGMPAWYVASLEYHYDNVYRGDIYDVTGWPLGEEYAGYTMESVGTIELNFASDEECTLSYNLDGLEGEMDIQRFMTEERYPGTPHQRGISGWWKDPVWDGMGWFVETRGGSMYVVWYHYGDKSQTRWWGYSGGQNEFPLSQQSYTGGLTQYSGGNPIGADPQGYSEAASMGEATLTDNGDGTITFSYDGVTYDLVPADF